ncbi:hypothetical protein RhiirA4_484060 [Rhizophagus irregularis]|uniref:Uncharacterized protein n=1 Tax=Rhizophagus irregularis TaxID=588596 RepID=A0A2I1HND7_9GLOM|nr:hypothetical protein RhiirA4_484060 [Rhizophagus irregularis]
METTEKKQDYQIVICQDGKFAATLDTANLRIKILQNVDYRPFILDNNETNSNNKNEFDEIVHFKINEDFTIDDHDPPSFDYSNVSSSKSDGNTTKKMINLGDLLIYQIMQLSKKVYSLPLNGNEHKLDMTPDSRSSKKTDENKKGIAIYRIELSQKEEYESEEKEKDSEKIENVEKKIMLPL